MRLWRMLRAEPVAAMAVITTALAILAFAGVNEKLIGSVGGLIGALLAFPVRNTVAPVDKVAATVKAVAQDAAAGAAVVLDKTTVGLAGQLTDVGAAVVSEAASLASNLALHDLGVNRHA